MFKKILLYSIFIFIVFIWASSKLSALFVPNYANYSSLIEEYVDKMVDAWDKVVALFSWPYEQYYRSERIIWILDKLRARWDISAEDKDRYLVLKHYLEDEKASVPAINWSCWVNPDVCISGTFLDRTNTATDYRWTCTWLYWWTDDLCGVAIINGSCWTANNVARTTAPTTNLCSAWTATSVTSPAWQYNWSCNWINTWSSASCSAPRQYTVTFNQNGWWTPSSSTKTVTYNTSVWTLATVSRTWYTFNGWYTATTWWTKITTSTKVTANVTWYAQWTVEVCTFWSSTFGNCVFGN